MPYQPTLVSVKTHPLPAWYDDAKLGIFIHWGLYSIPAFAPRGHMSAEKLLKGELGFDQSPYAEWYQNTLRIPGSPTQKFHAETYGKDFRYEQFAPLFEAGLGQWDPDDWAELFFRAGARYVVLVSKHHDGYLLWNSRHPNPRHPVWQVSRDVAGELTRAVQARGIKMGFYYSSLLDWSFTKSPITSVAELLAGSETGREYLSYLERHWRELIERYDPWVLWSDIGYPPGYDLNRLFADYYNHNPEGVVNDRWMQLPRFFFSKAGRFLLTQILKRMDQGEPPRPKHCDFTTPEYATLDHIAERKWETCRGIGNSFGYNRLEGPEDYQKAEDLIRLLADVVSKNGNLLLNVGPCADSSIHPLQREALAGLGAWLSANGEAIYATRPWRRFGDTDPSGAQVRYTSRGAVRYAIVTNLPTESILSLPADAVPGGVTLLETGASLPVERSGGRVQVTLPVQAGIPVLKLEPSPIHKQVFSDAGSFAV